MNIKVFTSAASHRFISSPVSMSIRESQSVFSMKTSLSTIFVPEQRQPESDRSQIHRQNVTDECHTLETELTLRLGLQLCIVCHL